MIKTIKKNIYLVTLPEIPAEKLLEYSNVLKLCTLLEEGLPKEQFESTLFVFANTDTRYPLREDVVMEVDTTGYKKRVLIWFGEELGLIPSDTLLGRFDITLKAYIHEDYAEKNLLAFPMLLPGEVPVCDIVPFEERKYNVFFSGNLNTNRVPLLVELNQQSSWWEKIFVPLYRCKGGGRLLDFIYGGKEFDLSAQVEKSIIRFNNGFNKGFSKPEYAAITANSKIILSPRGFVSAECFRIFESMRQGCVVICEQLPHTSVYKDIPLVQVKNWKNIRTLVGELLADEQKLKEMSSAAIKFYQNHLSLEAMAKYIISKM